MLVPSLINHRFKTFQRKAWWYQGIKHKMSLWDNVFFFRATTNFYISIKYIDLIVKHIKWKLKKTGFLVFPFPCNYPLTKKPPETRMGKGKGKISSWSIPIKWGGTFFYLKCLNKHKAFLAMKDISQKIPLWAKIAFTKFYLNEFTSLTTLKLQPTTFSNLIILEHLITKKL